MDANEARHIVETRQTFEVKTAIQIIDKWIQVRAQNGYFDVDITQQVTRTSETALKHHYEQKGFIWNKNFWRNEFTITLSWKN